MPLASRHYDLARMADRSQAHFRGPRFRHDLRQAILFDEGCYPCGMVRRQIEIDEDTDRILTELASEYEGNLS